MEEKKARVEELFLQRCLEHQKFEAPNPNFFFLYCSTACRCCVRTRI